MSCVIVALEPPATSAGHMTSGVKGLASGLLLNATGGF